jgi:hypothetical protein
MPQASRTPKNPTTPNPKKEQCEERVSIAEKDGRFAEAVFRSSSEPPVQFAIKTTGGVVIQPFLTIGERKIFPPRITGGMAETGVVLLPSHSIAYVSQPELVAAIKTFIHRYADVPSFWEDLAAHFILMTWVYDRFTAVPYLRFLGEPGTGKSRMLQVLGHLSYKGIFAGGATTSSPLFRLIEVYRGTLVIDEADYKTSDAWVDIIKILNSGYMQGVPVLRSEKVGDTYEPRAYDVFGPKIIGNRGRFKDRALETRCITLETEERDLRGDIPRQLPPQFYADAQELRNKLLGWRFDLLSAIVPDESALLGLQPRLTQIGTPLYSVSDDTGFRRQLVEFLTAYGREQQTEKPQALIVEAIANLTKENQTTLLVQKVANEANKLRMERGVEEEELSAKAACQF